MSRSMAAFLIVALCCSSGAAVAAEQTASSARVYNSISPSNGSLVSSAKPVISAEYLDDGIGVDPAGSRLYVDGADVTSAAQAGANRISYVPAEPLSDGVHKVKLEVLDRAGNVTSTAWTFTVSTQAPQVKITSHKQSAFVNRSQVLLTGTVSNQRAKIVVNGIIAAVERGVFSARVNLVEGPNTITAVATDPFGNTGSDSVTIVLDSKPPVIEITSPSSNSVMNARLVTVSGNVDKNAASVTVSTRGGSQAVKAELGAGTFTAQDLKLAEGTNSITVTAVSNAGNRGTASVKVSVDSLPPRVTITSPRDMTVTNKKMITVTGAVDDSTALVSINSTPAQVSRGAFTLSGVSLSEGSNTIMAAAVDYAGNRAKGSTVTVQLDTTPPPAPSLNGLVQVTRNRQVTVSGSSEPGARVEVFVNNASRGTARTDDKGNFSLRAGLAEGNNAITAVAYDASANASGPSTVQNIFLDTKPPRIL